MIELVLIACLLHEPKHCQQVYLSPAETSTVMDCMVTGQFRAVQWVAEHPDWLIRRWRCGMPRA